MRLGLLALVIFCQAALAEDFIVRSSDVVSVYDGDTFTVNIPNVPAVLGEQIGIRINGIDTPEYRSTCATAEDRAAERALAIKSKNFLEEQLLDAKYIEIRNVSRDKYFRLDADVFVNDISMGQLLLDHGYAIAYDGGTKISWCGKR